MAIGSNGCSASDSTGQRPQDVRSSFSLEKISFLSLFLKSEYSFIELFQSFSSFFSLGCLTEQENQDIRE